MKKALTLVLVLAVCLSVLSVAAFAADDYYCIAGTMNGWNSDSADRLTDNGDGTYSITFANMAAGSYEFKFTKNGSWDTCYGGAFLGSGQECDLYSPGSNISFTVEQACDVVIVLNLNTNKFTVTLGGKVDAPAEPLKVHISVPEDWGDVYVYVWNPEHLGSWAGTKVENGVVEIPASFEGLIVNNNNGRQTADIKDIDLTQKEVWIVVDSYNGYTLHYTDPGKVEEDPAVDIKIHVIAPDTWTEVYAYCWNPEHLGGWAGTKVENGVLELPAKFEGMLFHNGNGTQSWDIKDIDLTKAEVWVTINADGSYTLAYEEPKQDDPTPDVAPIKIHVIAEHWNAIYAYTYNPQLSGNWPGTKVENGVFETLACFEGLVLNNGEGQQTPDIKDIDLTKEEVWITVNADGSYTLSYEAPSDDVVIGPDTGDDVVAVFVVMMISAACAVTLFEKKKYI